VNACLTVLVSLGVGASKVSASDILDGQLGAVLSLLYALSTFKQQIKQSARAAALLNSPSISNSELPSSCDKLNSSKAKSPSTSAATMSPSSKLPSPSPRAIGSENQSYHTAVHSKLVVPTRIHARDTEHPPPSPAPVSKPSVAKNSSLRPLSRLQPPSVKTSNLNNNIPSRCSSRSSSLASSATYSSIPSLSSVPSSPGQSATTNIQTPSSVAGSKMLKIKLFGGGKEREKDRKSPSLGAADAKSSKSTNAVSKSSGLVKPKASGLKTPAKLMPPSHIVTKVPSVRSTSNITPCQQVSTLAQKGSKNASASTPAGLRPPTTIQQRPRDNRNSKSSEEDSAYAGFGSSSPISSTESSSMSLNSASSKNSSLIGEHSNCIRAPISKCPEARPSPIGAPHQPASPQDSKPVLAVKGISAPKTSRIAVSPSSKLSTPKAVNAPNISPQSSSNQNNSPSSEKPTEVDAINCTSSDNIIQSSLSSQNIKTTLNASNLVHHNGSTSTLPTSTSPPIALTTIKGGSCMAQSPTVGVVSPMMSHRTMRTPSGQSNDTGSQSDASTTSESRDSDNVSVIFNPSEETKRQSSLSITSDCEKKAPPVPVRTSSRLETTFDSNCCITTTDLRSRDETDLTSIRPMEPIIPRVPPPYSAVVRDGKVYRHPPLTQRSAKTATSPYALPDSSTSEDSLDSVSTAIRCNSAVHPSGYLSEGESLLASGSNFPDLSIADVSNGYVSEGGITIYARKMQARFREGLEAVRDSMRHRHHDYNDSFEDSSSISSGISENFDDISTDDLTGSSLSDHPMAATATYGKLGDYAQFGRRQVPTKRSVSASQPHKNTANALRLQQRRLHEQENVDQLLQKCRTSQRGLACNSQAMRYTESGQRPLYHTLGSTPHQVPQLALSDDGETLCVRNGSARSSLRMPSKQDHEVQAGPGFTSLTTGYHSLDRKAHLMTYYRPVDENPYRLAAIGHETSAATLAMVSPRRMPNTHHLSLAQAALDHIQPNRHSLAASRCASLSAAGMSRSMVLVPNSEADLSKTSSTKISGRLSVTGDFQSSVSSMKSLANFGRSPSASKILVKRIPLTIASGIPPSMEMCRSPRKIGGALSAKKLQSENIYANFSHRDTNLQLHKLSDDGTRVSQMKSSRYAESGYLSATSKTSPNGSADANGSQLSLASSSGSLYSTVEEKYEAEIRKLNREMESYRQTISKLTAKHDGYNHLIQLFDSKLHLMAKHVENLQNKSQLKKEEVVKLRSEIDHLRVMSISAGVNVPPVATSNGQRKSTGSPHSQHDGAGELLRHPSLESVTSHRSSMSSSSKGSKTDKSSLNSFGKQGKRSWIRSSFSKAFNKGKKSKNGSASDAEHSPMHTSGTPSSLKPITGSASRLDEIDAVPQVVELKKQLEDKDSALTDVRLDALDKAREVDILKETINRLKTENKLLKHNYTMLERRMRAESRASSQQSLSAMPDEDPVYEVPPPSDASFSASNRSSGCVTLRVTVSVDFSGTLRPTSSASEISIGVIPLPNHQTTWQELDSHLYRLFSEYISRIDPCGALGLQCKESMIGYEFGDFVRDIETNSAPSPLPANVIGQNSSIRIYLRGVAQRCLDGLILDCLFPLSTLDQLLKVLLQSRRLILFGATGIGKSNLARQLAKYLSIRIGGSPQDCIVDVKIGDDEHDRSVAQVQKQLESLLRSSKPTVILIDNVQRHRIAFLSASFGSVDTPPKEGPYVICTVNRASQLPEMQVHHNFRIFLLPNNMESIRGYMGRFLRRRILENEFRDDERASPEIYRIIEFLPRVLGAVNAFIEKSNSHDVTIGPRLFLQCPLDVEQSRDWFIKLWNQMIIPYMVKVAKEGVKVLGRCGSFEDPTDLVCEQWPWLEGPAAEQVLKRLSIKESISGQSGNIAQFDPLEALIRIQSNNSNATQQEVV
uniref:AAA+ ATPase domain-containing protein n=2 Tax=Parascaris univalens TaxID=6257 RepID=A0A914ZLJ3_PARUN